MPKRLRHVFPCSSAETFVLPHASAGRALHAFPDQRLWIYIHSLHVVQREDTLMSCQMRVDGRIGFLEEAHRHWIGLVFRTANAHEVANTPFDYVRVQEHRDIIVAIRWVGLQHPNTLVRAINQQCSELMRNHVVLFAERLESDRKCILVAPSGPTLGYHRVVVLGPIVVVV